MKWPLSVPSGTMAKPRGAVNSQVGQRPRTPASNSRWRVAYMHNGKILIYRKYLVKVKMRIFFPIQFPRPLKSKGSVAIRVVNNKIRL